MHGLDENAVNYLRVTMVQVIIHILVRSTAQTHTIQLARTMAQARMAAWDQAHMAAWDQVHMAAWDLVYMAIRAMV